MAEQIMKLAVGGPVQAKYGTYLARPADNQLFETCRSGEFAYVLACRQIGKSSLMLETSRRLAEAGVKTALIDLNSIGQRSVEADDWYFSLLEELARRLSLTVEVQRWWETKPSRSTLTQRFLQFFREIVLKQVPGSVVIFIDEIDMTLGLEFSADDFFAAIRSIYNDRPQNPDYRRLTFVLSGVATPDELIKDHTRTPFNIGQAISLHDFTKAECDPFRLSIETKFPKQGRQYFDQIYHWTDGHPYLTQKLCDAALTLDPFTPNGGGAALVDELVKRLFLAAESRAEDNIQFVQTRITSDPFAQEMLRIYKRVLEGEQPVLDDEQSPAVNRLKLYGLVVARSGKLAVRNKLYSHAFNLDWADEMLRVSSTTVRVQLPDHYKILQEIGQGGFATVYLAQYQIGDQTQPVALKVLKGTSLTDTTQVKRFKQEARTVARLSHPNIVHILETDGNEEGVFIAMEYIAAGNLRDRLKSGSMARNEAIHILKHIGAALSYAHEQGIIHRDIKPENILLDTSHQPVRPVLTDFGLIKVLVDDDHTKIQSSAIMGTFDYMAPEQWGQELPTPATDLYGLAITCFEMLTGKRPFASTSWMELMNKHANEPLPLLSAVAPHLGTFFDEILSRAAAKKPADRYEQVADFVAAMEAANAEAEVVEQARQKEEAAGVIAVARNYIKKEQYDPDKALNMAEVALEIYPNYVEALRLRGKIRWQQAQFEPALADYQGAYRQPEASTEIRLEYLELLSQAADTLWQQGQPQAAVKHYETIRQIVADQHGQAQPIQAVWQSARTRLVSYHHDEGQAAYAGGEPERLTEAIERLSQNSEALATLQAEAEQAKLQELARRLKIKKNTGLIEGILEKIKEFDGRESHVRFSNEEIFQDFQTLDEAYQALILLEPDQPRWPLERRQQVQERAQRRAIFAVRALNKLEPDYEAALRHYKAILELDPAVVKELELNLEEKIAELESKVDYDGKYNEIQKLITSGDQAKALEQLERDFIQERNYEHRDVAKLFWGLLHAKLHDGNFPPEWDSVNVFQFLSNHLIQVERGRIQRLQDKLGPWSQSKIIETIARENGTLKQFEEEIKRIETIFREAVDAGVTKNPELDYCRDELVEARSQIQRQRDLFFGVDLDKTTQKVEAWLQKIEDIEALLQTGNPIKDVPEFLERIDIEQKAIEKDDTFQTLQLVVATSAEIKDTIAEVKLRIKRKLIKILIEDVGRRDDQLAFLREQLQLEKEKVVQAELQASTNDQALLEARQIANIQQEKLIKLENLYQLNKYLIPLSLIVAVMAGGIIAAQLSSIMTFVALILLIFYCGYYVWVYYVRSLENKSESQGGERNLL